MTEVALPGQGRGQGPKNTLQTGPLITLVSITVTGKKRRKPSARRKQRNGNIQRSIRKANSERPLFQRERCRRHLAEGQKSPTVLRGDRIHALAPLLLPATLAGHIDQGQTEGDPRPVHLESQNLTLDPETDPIPEVTLDLRVDLDPTQGQGQEVNQDGLLRDLGLILALDLDTGQDPELDLGPSTGHSLHITEKRMHRSFLKAVHRRLRLLYPPLLKLQNPKLLHRHQLKASLCCL